MAQINRYLFINLGLVIVFATAITSNVLANNDHQINVFDGYLAATYIDEKFIAVGTQGKADIISQDEKLEPLELPTVENLMDIYADNKIILIGGSNGTMLYSKDRSQFNKCNIDTNLDIFALASSNGLYVAGSQGGTIFISNDGISWTSTKLPTDNDIVSVAANDQYFMLITRETDVFYGARGQQWEQSNFNKTYEGLYKPQVFTKVINMGPTFFVVGKSADNSGDPLIMYTEQGDVWVPRNISMINGKTLESSMPLEIKSLGYDPQGILAVCDGGRLLIINECVVCHEMYDISDKELSDIVYGNGRQLVIGEDFYFQVLKLETILDEI